MATSSTLPAVKTQLVTLLSSALATSGVSGGEVPVFYGPPGSNGEAEMLFLGRNPLPGEGVEGSQSLIEFERGAIGGSRVKRIETYGVDLTLWTWRPDLAPLDYSECEDRAASLFALVETVFAENEKLALESITKAEIGGYEFLTRPNPSGSGLVSTILATVNVQAWLT